MIEMWFTECRNNVRKVRIKAVGDKELIGFVCSKNSEYVELKLTNGLCLW